MLVRILVDRAKEESADQSELLSSGRSRREALARQRWEGQPCYLFYLAQALGRHPKELSRNTERLGEDDIEGSSEFHARRGKHHRKEQQERRLHFRSDETDEELVRMERDSDSAKDQDARTDQYRERNVGTAAIVEAFDRVAVKREAKVPLGQSPLFPL